MSTKVTVFPPDPKDIHDRLEEAGLDTMCWPMSADDGSATYRLILRGLVGTPDLNCLAEQVRGAFCEVARIRLHRLGSGQVVANVTVAAPKEPTA